MQENKIPFELVKDDNYRTIYVNGVFGGLDPVEGRMIFYIDEIEPEMDENTPGKMKVKRIVFKDESNFVGIFFQYLLNLGVFTGTERALKISEFNNRYRRIFGPKCG